MPAPPLFTAAGPLPHFSPGGEAECPAPPLPDGMRTFSPPVLHGWNRKDGETGRVLLSRIAERLGSGVPEGRWDLRELDADSRRFVAEVLGRGEITVRVAAPDVRVDMEESVFAGLWQIRQSGGDLLQYDYLEAGPLPLAAYEWAGRLTKGARLLAPARFPPGVMNAPAVLAEIADKSHNFRAGRDSVINLTLLPMTAEDLRLVADSLGLSGLSLLSRGYGDCRIHLTRVPHVWWVQYFNSPGQMILNTLEITAMPSVALAAAEDLADSAARLAETLAALEDNP
jgi:hydrogenase-1 operon protein HyaF